MVLLFFSLPIILHFCLATQQSDELRIKIGSKFARRQTTDLYSSTCHERTPSGPGKNVRTLQVAACDRDGWTDGGRQIYYTLQYYLLLSPPAIFLMNTRIVIIMYAIVVVNLKLMQHNNRCIVGLQYANVCIQRRPRWLSVFASISYVPFLF